MKKISRLSLNRETLRLLASRQLGRAAAGVITGASDWPNCNCTYDESSCTPRCTVAM
jgi:hypothetical protein